MQLVWSANLPSTQTLVAVRLADFADDDGGRVFPSNARVARECGLSDRSVRDTMRTLESIGVLVLVAMERPGQHLPREYRIDLDVLAGLKMPDPESGKKILEVVEGTTFRAELASGGNDVPGGSTFPLETLSRGNVVPDQGEPRSADPLLDPPRIKEPAAAGCAGEREAGHGVTVVTAAEVLEAIVVPGQISSPNPTSPPKPKSAHIAVGQRIASITGWDQDPRWFGNYSLVIPWLAKGWDPDLDIFPTVERLMFERKRRGSGPPRSLEYFQDAIAEAFAIRNREIPDAKTTNKNGNRISNHSGSVKKMSPHEQLFAAGAMVDAQLREKELKCEKSDGKTDDAHLIELWPETSN